jgi:hypothetical protein
LSIDFKKILLHAHGIYEEQNKVFKSSIIVINYCSIIFNAYYNYIINAQYNYYISNTGLLQECDGEENVKATVAPTTSCMKRRLKHLSDTMYSPNCCQAGSPMINIQSTLHTTLDLCKNDSLAVFFGRNGN